MGVLTAPVWGSVCCPAWMICVSRRILLTSAMNVLSLRRGPRRARIGLLAPGAPSIIGPRSRQANRAPNPFPRWRFPCEPSSSAPSASGCRPWRRPAPADGGAPWPFLPNDDIGAYAFRQAHPTWDGRGVVVAVFDTGVDAFAPGLATTSTGETKVIEARDFSTQGDWDLVEAERDTLRRARLPAARRAAAGRPAGSRRRRRAATTGSTSGSFPSRAS